MCFEKLMNLIMQKDDKVLIQGYLGLDDSDKVLFYLFSSISALIRNLLNDKSQQEIDTLDAKSLTKRFSKAKAEVMRLLVDSEQFDYSLTNALAMGYIQVLPIDCYAGIRAVINANKTEPEEILCQKVCEYLYSIFTIKNIDGYSKLDILTAEYVLLFNDFRTIGNRN